MKSISRVSGNDGHQSYDVGDAIERDSEWHRRMLCNGLAEPQDDAATKIAADPAQRARYASTALQTRARELAGDTAPAGKKKR